VRVGMVVNNLALSGGYQKLVLRLSRELERAGDEVTIYSAKIDRERCYPGEWPGAAVVTPAASLAGSAALSALGLSIDPSLDALVIHDEPSFAALVAFRRNGGRTRVVWMLNNELGWLRRPVSPRALARGARDAASQRSVRPLASAAREERRRRLLRAEARRATAFAVYDAHNADLVRQFLRRRAEIVHAGADVERFEQIGRRPRDPRLPFHVLSVGVLFPHRRYEDVIGAVAQLDFPARLTIVGLPTLSPDYARRIHALAEAAGPNVELVDYAPASDLDRLYADADAFAFVNDGHTWGIAAFEAIAASVPVVISDNIGASDLIHDRAHGSVVPPCAPASLARALTGIHDQPDRAARACDRARAEVLPVVRWPAYAERMRRLIVGSQTA
jgi:glycosyltransferase involved in cell wall biosynthesis